MLGFDPSIGKIPWRRAWHPTPVFLPGEFQGWRRLVGYSPQSHKELDMTEVTEHARTCVCGAESPPCSPESATILLISYSTIQKRKFKIWKKKEGNQSILSQKITTPPLYAAVETKRNNGTIKQPESNLMLLSSYISIIN